MTNLLRKKIALSTGIPPSIQDAEEFWAKLCAAADAWILRGLDINALSTIAGREVLVGENAKANTGPGDIFLAMVPDHDFGLTAIALNRKLATMFAAKRMHQAEASLEDASDLFLGLICEDPMMLLKESVKAHLTGNRHNFKRGIDVDLSLAHGEIEPLARYVLVDVEVKIEQSKSSLKLFFDYDILKQYLTTLATTNPTDSGSIELNKHSLIRNSLHKSDIRIDAVLERLEMSLGACSRLKIGQTLPLVNADQGSISIAVETISGSTDISQGRLGLWKQKRAIKLSTAISENFIRDLTAL